eukprot:719890-Pleurochrysis_carterae.AAC.1
MQQNAQHFDSFVLLPPLRSFSCCPLIAYSFVRALESWLVDVPSTRGRAGACLLSAPALLY